jgi:hypothetical protein
LSENYIKKINLKVYFMKLIPIFAHEKNILYSIQFDNNDVNEFRKAFDQWDDVKYLRQFFEENKSDLQSGFYGDISVEEAVLDTIDEGAEFEEYIRREAKRGENSNKPNLNDIFKTLNKYETSLVHEKNKAYGLARNSWLRMYAIRVSADIFVVSGSAIKLTGEMRDRVHTQKELDKLKQTSQYLKNNGLMDADDFMDADNYGFIDIN